MMHVRDQSSWTTVSTDTLTITVNLENWFSVVRAQGGFDNNPNAEQFMSKFKRLLLITK